MISPRGSFVRIPSGLYDYLLAKRFTASEIRILLWVVRKTFGWNRDTTLFTWYQIAKDLDLDRAGVLRAGKALVAQGVLSTNQGRIGLKGAQSPDATPDFDAGDGSHPVPSGSGDDDQRNRRQESPVFRRAIDSSKDKHHIWSPSSLPRNPTPLHPAGAAQPVAGKYDDISTI